MPSNVEIKARARDFARQLVLARRLAGDRDDGRIIDQEDTFFRVADGRLKLRRLSAGRGELIHYHRPDRAGPSRSRYRILPTTDPDGLTAILGSALGVLGVVRKRRRLFLRGRTRIHLDQVEGLGEFLELEVVLSAEQGDAAAATEAVNLMNQLEIAPEDLVETAYLDLLLASGTG